MPAMPEYPVNNHDNINALADTPDSASLCVVAIWEPCARFVGVRTTGFRAFELIFADEMFPESSTGVSSGSIVSRRGVDTLMLAVSWKCERNVT